MPLMSTAFAPGCAHEVIARIKDKDLRNLARAEYFYFSGQAEKAAAAAAPYLGSPCLELRLSACFVYGYANLANDEIELSLVALERIRETLAALEADPAATPEQRALAAAIATGASVLLHLPLPDNLSPIHENLNLLPPGLRFFALYVQAHHAYLQGEYSKSIGIVETALALQGEAYPISAIYLHMIATMDYMSMRQPEKARDHLLRAWDLAEPDDLIEAFAEHHGLLGGMLEAVIKKEHPEDFKRIIRITYSFSAGWRKIHNPTTGNNVADTLTTTEFAAAMLAARDWTNQEIAAHMGVSMNTVKRHISTVLQKLHITQRKDLKNFMLQ